MSVQYVAEMDIDLGEKVHVRSIVKPKCEEKLPFIIKTAKYELIDRHGSVEDSGSCILNENELDVLIAPKESGTYRLKYIYEIADEIWVDNIKLKVNQ